LGRNTTEGRYGAGNWRSGIGHSILKRITFVKDDTYQIAVCVLRIAEVNVYSPEN